LSIESSPIQLATSVERYRPLGSQRHAQNVPHRAIGVNRQHHPAPDLGLGQHRRVLFQREMGGVER